MIEFREADHTYWIAGVRVPNVSEILTVAGLKERPRYVTQEVWDRKAEIGKAAHLATEYDDQGILDEATVDEQIRPYLEGWRKFKEDFRIHPAEFTEIELVVYSLDGWYAGMMDRRWKKRVLDIKTGMAVPATGAQLAAYSEAYKFMTGEESGDGWAVHVNTKGSYDLKVYPAAEHAPKWRQAWQTYYKKKGAKA